MIFYNFVLGLPFVPIVLVDMPVSSCIFYICSFWHTRDKSSAKMVVTQWHNFQIFALQMNHWTTWYRRRKLSCDFFPNTYVLGYQTHLRPLIKRYNFNNDCRGREGTGRKMEEQISRNWPLIYPKTKFWQNIKNKEYKYSSPRYMDTAEDEGEDTAGSPFLFEQKIWPIFQYKKSAKSH